MPRPKSQKAVCPYCAQVHPLKKGVMVKHGFGPCQESATPANRPNTLKRVNQLLVTKAAQPLAPPGSQWKVEDLPIRLSYEELLGVFRSPLAAAFVGWARSPIGADGASKEFRGKSLGALERTMIQLGQIPSPLVNQNVLRRRKVVAAEVALRAELREVRREDQARPARPVASRITRIVSGGLPSMGKR